MVNSLKKKKKKKKKMVSEAKCIKHSKVCLKMLRPEFE